MVAAVTLAHEGQFNMSATGARWKPFAATQRTLLFHFQDDQAEHLEVADMKANEPSFDATRQGAAPSQLGLLRHPTRHLFFTASNLDEMLGIDMVMGKGVSARRCT